jgi:hypothetical protein
MKMAKKKPLYPPIFRLSTILMSGCYGEICRIAVSVRPAIPVFVRCRSDIPQHLKTPRKNVPTLTHPSSAGPLRSKLKSLRNTLNEA